MTVTRVLKPRQTTPDDFSKLIIFYHSLHIPYVLTLARLDGMQVNNDHQISIFAPHDRSRDTCQAELVQHFRSLSRDESSDFLSTATLLWYCDHKEMMVPLSAASNSKSASNNLLMLFWDGSIAFSTCPCFRMFTPQTLSYFHQMVSGVVVEHPE